MPRTRKRKSRPPKSPEPILLVEVSRETADMAFRSVRVYPYKWMPARIAADVDARLDHLERSKRLTPVLESLSDARSDRVSLCLAERDLSFIIHVLWCAPLNHSHRNAIYGAGAELTAAVSAAQR